MSHSINAKVLSAALAVIALGTTAMSQQNLKVIKGEKALCVQDGEKVLLRYKFADVPFKPYVSEWFTPGGINPLRDAPKDHLHHHALMYAVAVNKINFWEEAKDAGKEVHLQFANIKDSSSNGISQARFTEQLAWTDPVSNTIQADETRTITVYKIADLGASLLTWQTTLAVPKGKDTMLLTGHHYYGLGMRFLESMDKGGSFINSSGQSGELVRGDEYNVPADWVAYSAEADGKPVTAAMFDDPKNPRHPTTWFTMNTPFAYESATLNLLKEPMTITKDAPLTVRYGVALFDGKVDEDVIVKTYQRWLALIADAKTSKKAVPKK